MCSSSMKGMTGVTRPYKKISVNMPKPTVMRMKAVLDRHWSPIGAELRTLLSDMFGDGPVGVARYGQEAPPTGHEKKPGFQRSRAGETRVTADISGARNVR